ncbi:transposase [Funiculus sociatus GB2-C1]|uniref:transposase n=1 Tax=Trichocoleus sp. FACHB-69 TaxID=2692874 RepID=UPI0018EFCB22|nr:transposase [Trichocoleus sp. FACHB-69]
MALWRLYDHLVGWTKTRQPLITCERESLYSYVLGKGDILVSIIHAIRGIENYIDLVAFIPPTVSIADFVENIKGSSSHQLNE